MGFGIDMKITTLTLSPAVDIEYRAGGPVTGGLNRTAGHRVSAGGKGINVSRSILNCAARDRALNRTADPFELRTVAPVGGRTGELLASILEDEGIALTAVPVEENTRVNVSLIPETGGGKPLEINAPGTPVGDALGRIEEAALSGIGPGDVLVVAGSCPKDVPKPYPASLIAKAKAAGAFAVLDCDGEALRIAVNAPVKPDLIKPNREELASLCGCGADKGSIARAAESLEVPTVLTTLAGDGCLVKDCGQIFFMETVKRPVVRLKGAGDTFLGAYLYASAVRGDPILEFAVEYAMDIAGEYVAGDG